MSSSRHCRCDPSLPPASKDRSLRLIRPGRRNGRSLLKWFICSCDHRSAMAAAAAAWDVPAIESAGALADWLLLDHGELAWFADLKGLWYQRNRPRLRHYHQVRTKRSGSIRLIEAPKMRLKKLQRQILAGILAGIPPHSAAQGFLRGRSIKTFVAPHVGQRVVLRMDLQNFFPSIAGSRIQALFRTMGYPETVADLLGGICTNATPPDIWKDAVWKEAALDIPAAQLWEARALYSRPHLPRAHRPRRRLPTSAPTGWIAGWRGWRSRLAPSKRATPTIWRFPAAKHSRDAWSVFERTSPPFCAKRVSACTTARRASCARACGNTWRVWSPTGA